LLPVATGSVRFDGRDLAGLRPERVAELGLVHVPQGRQIVPNLTVEDNLLVGARHVRSLSAREIAERRAVEYARFPVLSERRHVAGSSLSGGEQQMLAISRALMMKPKALMLDEPSLGLAPRIVSLIMETLQALRDSGTTVVLVEQAAMLALSIADFGYVMKNGRVAMSGTARDLLGDRMLVESYLS
jgi:branched-chain amino acid transport system ATP-binding protein